MRRYFSRNNDTRMLIRRISGTIGIIIMLCIVPFKFLMFAIGLICLIFALLI